MFCSRACRNTGLAAAKRITKICVICSAPFTTPPAKANRFSTCSAACVKERKVRLSKARYALSQAPEAKAKRRNTFEKKRYEVPCHCGCGEILRVTDAEVRYRSTGRMFANREHYEDWFLGENTPFWRGEGNPYYRGPNWNAQRKKARKRDGFKCTCCGATDALVVHHIVSFYYFAEYREANDLNNLTTLCRSCHGQAHAEMNFRQRLPQPTGTAVFEAAPR